MPNTTAMDVNASGHLARKSIDVSDSLPTVTAGEALALGDILYMDATASKAKKFDGTEAAAGAILGVCDGTYALDATASYYPPGRQVTGLASLVAGSEYFAKGDGSLALYSALTSSQWTRSMGAAISATVLALAHGDVLQKP